MKKIKEFVKEYEKIITIILTTILIFITWRIGSAANNILLSQNKIFDQQTLILQQQTDLQSYALNFDKDKFRVETYNQYKKEIDNLFEKINGKDFLLTAVHNKVKNNDKVWDPNNIDNHRANLLKYIDEFEGIGMLYCSNRVKVSDIRGILKDSLKVICNSEQVNNYVQNTKSGLSAICKKTHPDSRMAKWSEENGYKCPPLNQVN